MIHQASTPVDYECKSCGLEFSRRSTAAKIGLIGILLFILYLMDSGIALVADELPDEPAVVWCEDRFAKPAERYLIREPVTVTRPGSHKVVVVIDGSSSLAASKNRLTQAIEDEADGELLLVLAMRHRTSRACRSPHPVFS